MKPALFALSFAAIAAVAFAQTTPKTTPEATPPTAKSSSTAATQSEPWIKLPPGVPHLVHGPVKIPLALRYEDIKVGTGPEGEPGKIWHVKYTGWRAADGVKFDSWDEHGPLITGKDGKPELGPDGKPKMGPPEPAPLMVGVGRVIPGFDYGVAGMRIGGKRRIFIPWQLAYGTREIRPQPDHPGIPAKSDLIFDVELVDVTDMPAPRPAAMPVPHPGVPPSVPPTHFLPGAQHPASTPQPSTPPPQ